MGLSCCKKIKVKNKSTKLKKGTISFEFDKQFEVPMTIIQFDGFLKAYYRIWPKNDKAQESSLKYFKKSLSDLDTVFLKKCTIKLKIFAVCAMRNLLLKKNNLYV